MKNMKKKLFTVLSIIVIIMATVLLSGCASCSRSMKSLNSDLEGGLDRTVTVYDYNGKAIKSWSGKIDLSESENEIFFDNEDGKRIVIHGGIVICEEN